ncbi:MAG: hypothetical protein IPJ30_03980 [Acidobacteria bacterium]|nr:hypothetical protein [Acidobacteriota bacterium]
MSKENAGAQGSQWSVAFPLTVAAMEKGRGIRDGTDMWPVCVNKPQSGGRV